MPGEPAKRTTSFAALGATHSRSVAAAAAVRGSAERVRAGRSVTRYATWDEVLDYCRRSANPVGRLVLRIAGYRDARLDAWSDAICTALQLTNFWQDLKLDYARGRVYLPAEELRVHRAPKRISAARV